ncbi:hypothetical protein AgCh_033473 [Apium graveolens]
MIDQWLFIICKVRKSLDCATGEGFIKHSGMKLPDTRYAWYHMKINLEECEKLCLKNCSCTAYAKADIRKGGRGCYLWFNDLIDIKGYSEDGPDIYIRMAASELALVITREISYNGHTLNEFVAQRTSAYVSQRDRHTAEMTVRETLELSGRCQGFGFKQDHESNHIEFDTDMLMELLRREKDLGIELDDDLDTFVKSIALGDQRTGPVVDYIMKIVGIDDLKKEVDKRGKDEVVTSRTSQSSPRSTARKGGIFRKQDIDSLFMEVSQELSSVMKDIVGVNHTKKFQSNFTSDKFVWNLENGEKKYLLFWTCGSAMIFTQKISGREFSEVGFADRIYYVENGVALAGTGALNKDHSNRIVMTFSGSVTVTSVLEVERKACIRLIDVMQRHWTALEAENGNNLDAGVDDEIHDAAGVQLLAEEVGMQGLRKIVFDDV